MHLSSLRRLEKASVQIECCKKYCKLLHGVGDADASYSPVSCRAVAVWGLAFYMLTMSLSLS